MPCPRPSIILVGGGGHALSCLDVLELAGEFTIAGIVDGAFPEGSLLGGYPVLGDDTALGQLRKRHAFAFIGVGQIRAPHIRMRLFERLSEMGFTLPVVVSPLGHVSPHAACAEGTIIMHRALVNSGARIGRNCIVNSGAIVEHECQVGDHCHIAVGAVLCGNVSVGDGAFVGAGAVVRQGVRIGENAVVGCGVSVLEDVPRGRVYVGKGASLRPDGAPATP